MSVQRVSENLHELSLRLFVLRFENLNKNFCKDISISKNASPGQARGEIMGVRLLDLSYGVLRFKLNPASPGFISSNTKLIDMIQKPAAIRVKNALSGSRLSKR